MFVQNLPIVDHSRAQGVPLTAYSPLARGRASESSELRAIAADHDAVPEQTALAFLMAEGHVIIPSSNRKERVASNFAAKDITLTTGEVARISALDEGRRLVNGDWCPVWDKA